MKLFTQHGCKRLRLERLEPRHLLAADPVITEFLASNDNVLLDGNGNSSDWVEIYNRGDQVAQLGGYYLTDSSNNLTKWQFPAGTTLGVGDYLVVFASGDGVPDLAGNLHTSYALSAGGEYVALVQPSGTTIVSEFGENGADYPEQFTDVSYGTGALGTVGFFFSPTPGAANGIATPQFSDRVVVFSRPAGTFTESSFQLELSSGTQGGSIVYTLDGSEPTLSSTTYTTPITISNSTNVRARVVTASNELGPVFGAAYIELTSALDTRTSELPIVVLDNFGGGEVTADYKDFAFSLYDVDSGTGLSSLQAIPDVISPSGLHIRGNSSSGFAKKQYRLELRNQTGEDQDFALAGLPEESDWVLFGPYVDKSLIRNPLAYELGRQLGLEAPRTRFVEVYLNQGNSSSVLSDADYLGVYTIRENIKIGENRVDIAKLDAGDIAEPDITGGYLLRFDTGLSNEEIIIDTGGETDLGLVDPQRYTAAQETWITNHVNEFMGVLNGPNFTDSVNGYAKYIDVDSFVNLMVVNELFRDQDAYFRSNYLYKDRSGKITQGPLWDYNLSLGVGCCRNNTDIEGWQYEENGGFFATQWFGRLLQDPNFEQRFRDRWAEARQTVFALDNINSLIDSMVTEIGTAADRNFIRWDILDDPGLPFSPLATDTYAEQIEYMRQWLVDRMSWIDSQLLFPYAPVISPAADVVPKGTQVTLFAPDQIADVEVVSFSSLAAATVPSDNSLETGPGPRWYDLSFDSSGWVVGTGGVGYEDSPADYSSLIGTDISVQWNSLAGVAPEFESSVYSRFEFTIPANLDLELIPQLTLRMRSDDGFVAYLNGQPVESVRAPLTVNWQSNSTSQRNDSTVVTEVEDYDLTIAKHLLQTGNNVLAIHGLNFNDTSSDLLIQPALLLGIPQTSAPVYYTLDGSDPRGPNGLPSGSFYTGPISLDQSGELKARSLSNGVWSVLSSANFVVQTADFDGDSDVDGGDFLRWQRGYGITSGATIADGDSDEDGDVDTDDLVVWTSTYGQNESAPSVAAASGQFEQSSLAQERLVDAAMAVDWARRSELSRQVLTSSSESTFERTSEVSWNSLSPTLEGMASVPSLPMLASKAESRFRERPWIEQELVADALETVLVRTQLFRPTTWTVR